MNHKEKYEDALKRARKFYNDCVEGDNHIQAQRYVDIFPELKENEDERIRKEIITLLQEIAEDDDYCGRNHCDEYIAWLEKQKEQQPNVELVQKSWYLEGYHDGKYNNEPKWLIQTGEGGPRYEENPKYGTQKPALRLVGDGLISDPNAHFELESEQKPAGWSEEDEYYRNQLIVFCENCMQKDSEAIGCATWLKSLRHQPHWKPSKEEMEALEDVLEAINNKTNLGSLHLYKRGAIGELYQQLKKL